MKLNTHHIAINRAIILGPERQLDLTCRVGRGRLVWVGGVGRGRLRGGGKHHPLNRSS